MGKAELKIEIDEDLLAQAAAAGIDVAQLVEASLRDHLPPVGAEERARRWIEENAEALKAQRERIDAVGVFGEDLRSW